MSITSICAFKTLKMADSSLLPLPSLFYSKTKYHFLSSPSKPLQLHFSQSHSSQFSHSLSLTIKTRHSSRPAFVAQTSDWTQQGEDGTVAVEDEGEPAWENEDTEARLSDWETEGGDTAFEGSQGEGDGVFDEREEDDFVEPPEDAKIYVGNLPYDVDSEKLAMLFEQAGTVEIAEVIYNRETDRSRGFGFVTMSTVEESEKAVEKFNRYDLDGRLLVVNKAAPRGARVERPPRVFEPAYRVYAGNLPWDVDNARLEELFSEHGKVVNARVVYHRDTGRSRGFGFVTMSSETEMNDAVAALDGQSLDGRAIRVNVAEERRRGRSF